MSTGKKIFASALFSLTVVLVGKAVDSILAAPQQPWPESVKWLLAGAGLSFTLALLVLVPGGWWKKAKFWIVYRPKWVGDTVHYLFHRPQFALDVEQVTVEKVGDLWLLTLILHLCCKNNDPFECLELDCENMWAILRGKGVKGFNPSHSLTYHEGIKHWRILPEHATPRSEYQLSVFSQLEPRLGHIASCQKIKIGEATLRSKRVRLALRRILVCVEVVNAKA